MFKNNLSDMLAAAVKAYFLNQIEMRTIVFILLLALSTEGGSQNPASTNETADLIKTYRKRAKWFQDATH